MITRGVMEDGGDSGGQALTVSSVNPIARSAEKRQFGEGYRRFDGLSIEHLSRRVPF
jgi:hypothetical protein